LDYFTEIDAVLLIGEKYVMNTEEFNNFWSKNHTKQIKGPITSKLERVGFFPQIQKGVNQNEIIQEFFENGINSFIKIGGNERLYDVQHTKTQASLNSLPVKLFWS
jgi:hypothetical protein